MTLVFSISKIAAVSVLCLLGSAALAENSLAPHKAQYKVKISVLGGQLNTQLSTTRDGYVATHTVKPTGMSRMLSGGEIKESSYFDRVSDGVRPVTFVSNDTLTRDKTRANIRFDWDTNEAIGVVNDEEFQSTIDELAFDRVSIQYELMSDLLNNNPSAEYVLFDIDELKKVQVRNIGSRKVKVPAGEYEAVGIQHQVIGSKRITTMWCVEELDFLPAIIEQHRKGKLKMRAVLSNYEPLKT
jgi:hypothetical protein